LKHFGRFNKTFPATLLAGRLAVIVGQLVGLDLSVEQVLELLHVLAGVAGDDVALAEAASAEIPPTGTPGPLKEW
jgi:hypothetical protein